MTRPVSCARIHAIRRALDELKDQAEADGLGCIPSYGSLKVSLIQYEQQLRDHAAAERGQAVSDFARDLVMAPLAVQLAAVVNHALARREG
jgi:hypothetical protein